MNLESEKAVSRLGQEASHNELSTYWLKPYSS